MINDVCGYFTIKQANDAIPHVSELYNNILECRKEIMRAEQNLATSDGSLASYDSAKTKAKLSCC